MTTKYTKDHEWVRADGDVYAVGVTDHAQEQLGEIVFVDLPEVDATVTVGEEAAVVESVKAASDVKSPVSGTVTAVNEKLDDTPELVNESPEGDGWFYKVRADDARELEGLMDAGAYKEFLASLE